MGNNLTTCIEDGIEDGIADDLIFHPKEKEIVVPSIHLQEDKCTLATENHQAKVSELEEATANMNGHKGRLRKSVSGRVLSKVGKAMGNPSDRKLYEADLATANDNVSKALVEKLAAERELQVAVQVQKSYMTDAQEARKVRLKKIEVAKAAAKEVS